MSLAQRFRRWVLGQPGKRMPLSDPPFPVAGQSLGAKRDDYLLDVCFGFLMMAAFVLVAMVKYVMWVVPYLWRSGQDPWWVILANASLTLLIHVIVPLPFCWLVWVRTKRVIQKLRNHHLGFLGERYVGQQLDRVRFMGYSVFHDIQIGDKEANIDHLLIGPGGIFVVETKTCSKPEKGGCTVKYTGDTILVNGRESDRNPVRQVQAEADYIRDIFESLLDSAPELKGKFTKDRPLPIRQLLVYPGWYVDYSEAKGKNPDLRVVNDTVLLDFVNDAFPRLEKTEYIALGKLMEKHLREQHRWVIEYY